MSKSKVGILDVVRKAREYDKTKSITTAVDVAKMLNEWADNAGDGLDILAQIREAADDEQ